MMIRRYRIKKSVRICNGLISILTRETANRCLYLKVEYDNCFFRDAALIRDRDHAGPEISCYVEKKRNPSPSATPHPSPLEIIPIPDRDRDFLVQGGIWRRGRFSGFQSWFSTSSVTPCPITDGDDPGRTLQSLRCLLRAQEVLETRPSVSPCNTWIIRGIGRRNRR